MLVNTDNNKNDYDNDNINGSDNDDANDGKRGECVTIVIDYFGFIKGNQTRPSIALKKRLIFKIRIFPKLFNYFVDPFYRNGRLKTTQRQVYIRS